MDQSVLLNHSVRQEGLEYEMESFFFPHVDILIGQPNMLVGGRHRFKYV